jgi:O-antigen/teichoic acid export membrane protein
MLLRSIVLARLLTPADFGLMGLASLTTAALLVFTETGIYMALLQRKTLDRETEDTAWLIMAGRGVVLGLILLFMAPWIARFFAQQQLGPVLRALAGLFVLTGLNSLSVIEVQRDLRFERIAFLNAAVAFVSFFVWTGAAFVMRNVWALVIGELISAAVTLVLTYRLTDYRPRLRFSTSKAKELLNFGRFLTLSGIITYLATQGDDALVGKLLGTPALGYYERAYSASNLPATSISHVINRVTVPAFSRVQDDIQQLRTLYLNTLRITALVIFPFVGLMFVLADQFIPVVYGSMWIPAIPAFTVLCFFGLERAIGSLVGPVFVALGHTRLLMLVNLSKLVSMAALIVPLTMCYDFLGTSVAVTVSALVVQMVVLVATSRLLEVSVFLILGQVARPAIVTVSVVVMVSVLQRVTGWSVGLGSLLVQAASGGLLYALIIGWWEKPFLTRILARHW